MSPPWNVCHQQMFSLLPSKSKSYSACTLIGGQFWREEGFFLGAKAPLEIASVSKSVSKSVRYKKFATAISCNDLDK